MPVMHQIYAKIELLSFKSYCYFRNYSYTSSYIKYKNSKLFVKYEKYKLLTLQEDF